MRSICLPRWARGTIPHVRRSPSPSRRAAALLAALALVALAGRPAGAQGAGGGVAGLGSVSALADSILVEKASHRMTVFHDGRVLRTYQVALGAPGQKERQGDRRTPEGRYWISGRNAKSAFHLSLRISYPSASDIERAALAGTTPGGDLMIHGLPNGRGQVGAAHRQTDWTWGCIAVTDQEIEELWRLIPDGVPIEIRAR